MHGDSELVRGVVGARPWGPILGGLGIAARTVLVTIRSEDKVYRVAFDRGLVVAASSPVAADAVTRIALANHMIVTAQVDDIKRRIAVAANLDEVDVLAATAHLDPERTRTLRDRVVLQRAARTFAIEQGDYEIEDRVPIAGSGIDIRSVVFLGARMNLPEDRLRAYLRELGPRFAIKAGEDLGLYGFTPAEQPMLETLRNPTSVAELEANHRDIDSRGIQAVVYALGACNALTEIAVTTTAPPVMTFPDRARVEALMRDKPQAIPPATRTATVQITERVRISTRAPVERDQLPPERMHGTTLTSPTSRATRTSAPPMPAPKPSHEESAEITLQELSVAEGTPSVEPPTKLVPPAPQREEVEALSLALASFELDMSHSKVTSTLQRQEVIELINQRMALIASGADHFTLLGVPLDAPIEIVNAAYIEIARQLRPEYLADLDVKDEAFSAESLLAQLGLAVAVLTDRPRRLAYLEMLRSKPSL